MVGVMAPLCSRLAIVKILNTEPGSYGMVAMALRHRSFGTAA